MGSVNVGFWVGGGTVGAFEGEIVGSELVGGSVGLSTDISLGLKHRSQVINTRGCKTGSSFKSEIKIHSAIEGG